MVVDHRAGIVSGFVTMVEYVDADGEPCYMILSPPKQGDVATLGQLRAMTLNVEHNILRGFDEDDET